MLSSKVKQVQKSKLKLKLKEEKPEKGDKMESTTTLLIKHHGIYEVKEVENIPKGFDDDFKHVKGKACIFIESRAADLKRMRQYKKQGAKFAIDPKLTLQIAEKKGKARIDYDEDGERFSFVTPQDYVWVLIREPNVRYISLTPQMPVMRRHTDIAKRQNIKRQIKTQRLAEEDPFLEIGEEEEEDPIIEVKTKDEVSREITTTEQLEDLIFDEVYGEDDE